MSDNGAGFIKLEHFFIGFYFVGLVWWVCFRILGHFLRFEVLKLLKYWSFAELLLSGEVVGWPDGLVQELKPSHPNLVALGVRAGIGKNYGKDRVGNKQWATSFKYW